jgi:hypothetical protein
MSGIKQTLVISSPANETSYEQVRNQLAANLFEYLIFQSPHGFSLHREAYGEQYGGSPRVNFIHCRPDFEIRPASQQSAWISLKCVQCCPISALKARFGPNIDHRFRFDKTFSHVRSQPLLCLEPPHLEEHSGHPGNTLSRNVDLSLAYVLVGLFRGASPKREFNGLETHAACSRQCTMFRSNRRTFWCLRRPFARLCPLANRQPKIS